VLWIAALLPFLMAPALGAVVYALVTIATSSRTLSASELSQFVAIVVVATFNVWLSYELLGVLAGWLGDWGQHLLQGLPTWLPKHLTGTPRLQTI
jgi:hypothetical protein